MATQQQQIDFEVTTDNHSPPLSSQEDAANMEGEDVDAIIAGNKKQLTTNDNNANDTESEGTLPREAQLTNAATAAPRLAKRAKKERPLEVRKVQNVPTRHFPPPQKMKPMQVKLMDLLKLP